MVIEPTGQDYRSVFLNQNFTRAVPKLRALKEEKKSLLPQVILRTCPITKKKFYNEKFIVIEDIEKCI